MEKAPPIHPNVQQAVSSKSLAGFSIFAGILATGTLGYHFGLSNHIELLPPVLRILDPQYCLGDFAVNASAGYGHRFFFSHLCALLARGLPLSAVLLLLTLVQNIGVALVTGFAARDLHGRRTAAPLVAILLVLTLDSIQLGGAGFLRQPYGLPGTLVTSTALLALWQGIRLRPFAALALAMPAALLHPLIGLEIGGVALGICGLSALLDFSLPPARRRRRAWHSLAALMGLGLFGAGVWGPALSHNVLGTEAFLDIYARFRAPHHILPSTFRPMDYVAALSFLVAAGLSWKQGRSTSEADNQWNRGMLIGSGLILILLFCGWFFVEVLPSRLWATLQTFRLIVVLKWFGLLLFAGTIGRAWSSKEKGAGLTGTLLFLPVGYGQPFGALWAHGIELVRRRIPASRIRRTLPLLAVIGFAGLSGWLLLGPAFQTLPEAFTLISLSLLLGLFWFLRTRVLRHVLSLLFVAGVIGLLAANRSHRIPIAGNLLRHSNPIFTLADAHDPADPIAWFCRTNLPPDALVLTPPNMGRFRLVAERALVVDFKFAMPSDSAWIEWRQRMADCYGAVSEQGFDAARTLDRQYVRITDAKLADLAATYGITHAVLHARTPSRLPVAYADTSFKLVLLPVRQPARAGKRPPP